MSEIDKSPVDKPLDVQKLEAEINELKIFSPIKAIATVVTGFLTLWFTYYGLFAGDGPAQEALENAKQSLLNEKKALELASSDFADGFYAVFTEPSGLVSTCLSSELAPPIFLAIDDEISFPILLTQIQDNLIPMTRRLAGAGFDDLEVVTVIRQPDCKDWRYFIMTSHRQYEEKNETRVFRFGLTESQSELGTYDQLEPEKFSLRKGILDYLQQEDLFSVFDDGNEGRIIEGIDWNEKHSGRDQEFALEIEGATVVGNNFWVGLKYPLKQGKAVLLRYDRDEMLKAKKGPKPKAHQIIDLSGRGISAMTSIDDVVYVASNPTSSKSVYRESYIHKFKVENENWISTGAPVQIYTSQAKLEGLAIHGDNLWMAFDGDTEGSIERESLVKLFP